ncbi:AIR synthase-related protein [Cellulomonas xiejunii]|uniref:AIR synthase-related protein n=1 Tax=Cellulomonas xiejunii TaxID=2968083 RepID=UPI0027DFDA8E|nr:AIR synthase-related protein [Cellulomonas xiejunii]
MVAYAGRRGWSAAGLALLSAGLPETDPGLTAFYRAPTPPLDAGPAAARAGATAMLDVSDGLLRDASRIARASGVTLHLEDPAVAFVQDASRLAGAAAALGADLTQWLLTGGEDHGLLATFPPGVPIPEPFGAIGVVSSRGSDLVLVGGEPPRAVTTGWDHFGD